MSAPDVYGTVRPGRLMSDATGDEALRWLKAAKPMACPACARATVQPHCGLYFVGCRGCDVRSVALSPQAIRRQFYEQLPEPERAAFIADVSAEHERWSNLKTNPPETA